MDREVSRQVDALNLQGLTVVLCGEGLAASAHRWLYLFLAGKRTPAALQEASREEPEAPQGEPALVSVRNLQDNPVLQDHRASRRPRGGDMTLCHSCVLAVSRLHTLWRSNMTQIC